MTERLVILVEFETAPASVSAFRDAVCEQARASLAAEPDCTRFDVCIDAANPLRIVLYEVYESDAAFDEHLATPHYRSFDAKSRPLIVSKSVRRLRLAGSAAI